MHQGGSQEYLNHLQDRREPPPPQIPDFLGEENHQQPPPSQKCPRCDSSNTKFCYYNNYSLSQPRYFCKACRRYWTHGGTLRNVPIGGGCRKIKRPKPSPSSSPNSDMARGIQSSSPVRPSQNLISAGVISGQSIMRPSPPVNIPPPGNISFYTGGAVLPSLAAMQPLPTRYSQVTAPVSFGAGGSGQFGTLIQGMNLQSLKHPSPQQIQAQNILFPSQQSLILQRPISSWTQTSINRGITAPSAASASFWSGAATGGNPTEGRDPAGSSLNPNQWPDHSHPCYDPSNNQ
ncbi:hypothetical protein F511_37370 [Dorcoceras hygrometricum]|uniref:Dof zinc finger protein n=1 Tax=Dorcoceras hygrometricum TaxID=472368 RepID=A0A2Z7ASZ2_9LAMI|nr:hypothetical protein F511_37370 [Dorcoceras hygrometricum]